MFGVLRDVARNGLKRCKRIEGAICGMGITQVRIKEKVIITEEGIIAFYKRAFIREAER